MAKKKTVKDELAPPTLVGLSLIDVEVDFDPFLEVVEDFELEYSVELTPPEIIRDGLVAYQTEFFISKAVKDGEDQRSYVKAIYLCGMKTKGDHSNEVIEKAALNYAKTVVWGNFSSLAAIITQQMSADFPRLPPVAFSAAVKERSSED